MAHCCSTTRVIVDAAMRISLKEAVSGICALHEAASTNPTHVQQQREAMAMVAEATSGRTDV
jgi:hypothetical protein